MSNAGGALLSLLLLLQCTIHLQKSVANHLVEGLEDKLY